MKDLKFHPFLLKLDSDLATRFLGDNLITVSEAAWASKIPVFMAAAASTLEHRVQALAAWRAQQVASLNDDPGTPFRALLEIADPSAIASVRAGEVDLAAVNVMLNDAYSESETSRIANRRARKYGLLEVARDCIRDVTEKNQLGSLPRHILILGNGEITFWRYKQNGVTYSREAGLPCIFLAIDGTRTQIRPEARSVTDGVPLTNDVKASSGDGSERGNLLDEDAENAKAEDEIADFEEFRDSENSPRDLLDDDDDDETEH